MDIENTGFIYELINPFQITRGISMRKIRRTWKVYAIIIIFCTILILQKNNLIYYIANMPKGYADNVWESNYTYEAAPYLEDFFGSEMTEYLSNSLLSNEVDDRLHEIAANYRKLNVIEKIKVIMNSKDNIFLKHYCDEGSIWDTWYQINLYPEVHTALSDTDIVISHVIGQSYGKGRKCNKFSLF